ncbi:hypothetical protein E2C01_011520 [Portunus trituberculatus]|uniref:Spastin/Vps4 C-terminal domain-containing protein n=1 Tax=Portunus trituberculatus TaxID=210409 RepID=A0A5B7DBH0_PORTR|nr:hypothetical protein [Portunus trituberculatus]
MEGHGAVKECKGQVGKVRPITLDDFVQALSCIKASVSDKDLHMDEGLEGAISSATEICRFMAELDTL